MPESLTRAHNCIRCGSTRPDAGGRARRPDRGGAPVARPAHSPVVSAAAPVTDVRRAIDSNCRSTSDVDTFVIAFPATSTTRKAATLTSESATQDVCVV